MPGGEENGQRGYMLLVVVLVVVVVVVVVVVFDMIEECWEVKRMVNVATCFL